MSLRSASLVILLLSAVSLPEVAQGQQIITTFAGNSLQCGSTADGVPATSTSLCTASAPLADGQGNVYFFDNHRIRRVNPAGIIETIAGTGEAGSSGDGGPALFATLGAVRQMALYVDFLCFADEDAHKIRCVVFSSGMIFGLGTGVSAYAGDGGPLGSASFQTPRGFAIDEAGNMYIADFSSNAVRRADNATGIVTTIVGPGPGYSGAPLGDGGPALGANILQPWGLFYRNGALYIADGGNNRLRKVNLSTGIIETVAGNGSGFNSGDGGPAVSAGLSLRSIAGDADGNLFVGAGTTIRKIDPSGIITTIVGIPGTSGYGADDVPATQSATGGINGVVYDALAQRLLLADTGQRVRQIYFTPATNTSLSVTPNPATWGQPVELQATVNPGDATGNVRFYAGGTLLGSIPVSGGFAGFTWTAPTGGQASYDMRAVYGGDATHNLSSQTVSLTTQMPKAPSSTSLGASTFEAVIGETITFTAYVNPTVASGNVAFRDNGVTIGTVALASGTAAFSTNVLTQGAHSITAYYAGSISVEASNSAPVNVAVKAAVGLNWSSNLNPSVVGQLVTFTAQIIPAAATGQIQFRDNGAIMGSGTLANGTAVFSTSSLSQGQHKISLTYSGDANHLSANTSSITQTVGVNSVVALLSNLNPSLSGQPVQFTATITPASATGTVQFRDGAALLGQASIVGGTATLTVSSLAVGSHSIQALYGGNTVVFGSDSPLLTQVVKTPATVGLTSSKNPQTKNKPVTFTATVSVASATGTVQFRNGSSILGTSNVVNGKASFTVTAGFNSGSYPITAVYSGNATLGGSTSAVLTQVIR